MIMPGSTGRKSLISDGQKCSIATCGKDAVHVTYRKNTAELRRYMCTSCARAYILGYNNGRSTRKTEAKKNESE